MSVIRIRRQGFQLETEPRYHVVEASDRVKWNGEAMRIHVLEYEGDRPSCDYKMPGCALYSDRNFVVLVFVLIEHWSQVRSPNDTRIIDRKLDMEAVVAGRPWTAKSARA